MAIASSYMKLPVRIEIARSGTMAENVTQELYVVNKDDKIRLLDRILAERRGSVLVFTRTKHGAKKVAKAVRDMGHTSSEIHSNRSLAQRREALDGFKSGKYRVLVATDIAARRHRREGHRARGELRPPVAGPKTTCTASAARRVPANPDTPSPSRTPDQRKEVEDIERLTRTHLPISKAIDCPRDARSRSRQRLRDRRRSLSADSSVPDGITAGDGKKGCAT